MTVAENILWNKLEKTQFHDLKFRRQHPINTYIADFYCHELKLIIEIDGEYHDTEEQNKYDIERTNVLEYHDLKVIRFTNDEIVNNINSILIKLEGLI